jgi:hypothetical protein
MLLNLNGAKPSYERNSKEKENLDLSYGEISISDFINMLKKWKE